MAGWISSKLKVAETLLQQIDQQAAESLRKGEHIQPEVVDKSVEEEIPKVEPSPVKFQISRERKPLEREKTQDADNRSERITNSVRESLEVDWTELLSSSSPSIGAGTSTSSKSIIKQGSYSRRSSGKISRENDQRRRVLPDRVSDSSGYKRIIPSEAGNGGSELFREIGGSVKESPGEEKVAENSYLEKEPDVGSRVSGEDKMGVDEVTDLKVKTDGNAVDVKESDVTRSSSSNRLRIPEEIRFSGSDSESASSSDSEYEREREIERRKRREKILAEKSAALAAQAIKERENLVARLEGERESLQKVVEERQKQQAQEASQLQSTMMETMEAVELEKQKHKSTRMEAFALLAELETRNAELSRFLASAQWDLQVEVDRVLDLREIIQSKELVQEEIKRRMSDIHLNAPSDHKDEKRNEYERKVLEAEYHFICDKIGQMKEKVRTLERNIQMTKELAYPTDGEVELKKRLMQFTDHLIQKQAQVETLSSEKATLQFRIETVSRLVAGEEYEGESHQGLLIPAAAMPARVVDIDGSGGMAAAGERKVTSLLWQLDLVLSAGMVFLRKNPAAKISAWVYLLCLHLWVGYILTSAS